MISSYTIAMAIKENISESPSDVDELVNSVISFLEKNHMLNLLPNIIRNLEIEKLKEEKDRTVEIIVSHDFEKGTLDNIKKISENAEDKDFNVSIEPSIISGFIVKEKNRIFDASLKSNIDYLRDSLLKSI